MFNRKYSSLAFKNTKRSTQPSNVQCSPFLISHNSFILNHINYLHAFLSFLPHLFWILSQVYYVNVSQGSLVFPSVRFGFYHNNCHDYSKYSVTFHAFWESLSDYRLSLFPSSDSWSLYFSKDIKLLNPNCRFKLETFSINYILRIVEYLCIRFKMCPRTLGISMENYFFTMRLRRVLVFEGQLVTQVSCWTLFRILVGVAVSQ